MTQHQRVKLALVLGSSAVIITVMFTVSSVTFQNNYTIFQVPAITGMYESGATMGGGYVIASSFWEQLTSACRNLHSLQCWASAMGMSVVEPFIRKSFLESLNSRHMHLLRFRDVYDIEHWGNLSREKGYVPLAAWEQFMDKAPTNLIVVTIKYFNKQKPDDKNCYTSTMHNQLGFFTNLHFTVVREVCVNFAQSNAYTMESFQTAIFGDHPPHNSTVLFSEWRGFNHIKVKDIQQCSRISTHMHTEPSKRVILDAQRYSEKYLKTDNYIALVLRMEKARIFNKRKKGSVSRCYRETLKQWREMTQQTGVNATFLASDVGRFGSWSFRNTGDETKLADAFLEFFDQLYQHNLTLKGWEDSFVDISGQSESGYIGMLQKAVAVRAKCILFLGGGAFQNNAVYLHRKIKTGQGQKLCIQIVKTCSFAV